MCLSVRLFVCVPWHMLATTLRQLPVFMKKTAPNQLKDLENTRYQVDCCQHFNSYSVLINFPWYVG